MTESQSPDGFIKQVKRRTKKKYSAEDKIRVVLEGMKREVPVAELCRREGIHGSWESQIKGRYHSICG